MTKHEVFFYKLEKETFELMQFKEHLIENNFPKPFEDHELEFFKDFKIIELEEDLITARDLIERDSNASEKHKNIVDFLELLLDEYYKM